MRHGRASDGTAAAVAIAMQPRHGREKQITSGNGSNNTSLGKRLSQRQSGTSIAHNDRVQRSPNLMVIRCGMPMH